MEPNNNQNTTPELIPTGSNMPSMAMPPSTTNFELPTPPTSNVPLVNSTPTQPSVDQNIPVVSSMPQMGDISKSSDNSTMADLPSPSTSQNFNPASEVANFAINGAEPVVDTSDFALPSEPASSITPPTPPTSPTLQDMANIPENPSLSTTPSQDYDSANSLQSQDYDLSSPIQSQPYETPVSSQSYESATNFANNEQEKSVENNTDFLNEPITAANPVPGSIGSTKSYLDIQREEAEKAARLAVSQAQTGNKKKIIIGAIIAVIFVAIGILAFFLLTPKPKKTTSPTPKQKTTAPVSTTSKLSCKRALVEDEYSFLKAKAGTWENIFLFKDDLLNGLITNLTYNLPNATLANEAKAKLLKDNPTAVSDTQLKNNNDQSSSKDNNSTSESIAEPANKTQKTADEMLKRVISLDGLSVTHHMEVTSEDIEQWQKLPSYTDTTYGAKPATKGEVAETPTRNLKYFLELQNNFGYSCTASK